MTPATRDIRPIDSITPEARERLFRFEPDVFSLDPFDLEWAPKERFFHVYVAGDLVANAGVLARTVDVGGAPIPVAGIGGVVCRPEARGQGHATAAVAAALTHGIESLGADFGMLFCLPKLVPFYARTGWQRLAASVLIEQSKGKVPSPLEVMIKPPAGRRWPSGNVDVNGRPW